MLEAVLNTLISIILSAVVTVKIVEEKKKKEKRNLLINILDYELSKYYKPEKALTTFVWITPHRSEIISNILTSDVLDPKKAEDLTLIKELYELFSWTECHKNYCNLSNLSMIHNSNATQTLNELTLGFAKKSHEQSLLVRELINKYK